MVNTHYKFHLQTKVTRTTTDNGSNFVKAFVQFGSEADVLPVIPEPNHDDSDEDIDQNDNNQDIDNIDVASEAVSSDQVEFISLSAALDDLSNQGHNLPVHMRCAAHTFNLVASVDVDKALDSGPFKTAYRKVMVKAQALWNLQGRSTVAADTIVDELKRRLVVPNSTRWNSMYDSVVVLNKLLDTDRGAIHRVMTQLKLQNFTDADVGFLKEYSHVMSIAAKALDKMQGEDQAYLGCLLPTVAATIMKLHDAKSQRLAYCMPLVDAVLSGTMNRFGALLDDMECQLAAAFHPKFRLIWLNKYNASHIPRVKKAMENAVEAGLQQQEMTGSAAETEATASSSDGEEDDFFSGITMSENTRRSQRSAETLLRPLARFILKLI
jgi:hypothetical protein